MSQIKIAFLTPEFPHPKTPGLYGGIGTSILNLSKGLLDCGSKVTVLVYGQEEDEVHESDGISIYRIKNSTNKWFSRYLTQKKIERLINSLVKQQLVSIVEAPDWTGITSFIRPKCPVVVKLHGSDTYFSHFDKRPISWQKKFHEKRALNRADALISVSQFTADVTRKIFGLQREFTIIPNGLDSSKFKIDQSESERKLILYFGTLVRKKGSLELPMIFNKVVEKDKEAKLVLVGLDSNDRVTGNHSVWKMMQPLFSAEALANVSYEGSVAYSEIRHYINSAAVCVFPSLAEALPVSWLEAMIMGKAVVASNIGWAAELIDDGENGFLVDPTQHHEFAQKIIRLLENRPLRQKFGANAISKVTRKFTVAVVARQSISFYKAVIAGSKRLRN